MRTSSTAWTAALAIMSMRGPLTTAEAAPARHYDAERQRHYFPKHLRRGGYNESTSTVESSSSSSIALQPDFSSVESSSPPPTTPDYTPPDTRTRSSTQSSAVDEEALIESLIDAGVLPETTNAVVTTTVTIPYNAERTATYTLTYTETSSPIPGQHPESAQSQPPVPLTSSKSIPVPVGTAPEPHKQPKKVTTRGTTTTNVLGSIVPSLPVPLNGGASSHAHINSRTHKHHNTTTEDAQPNPLYTPPTSSSVPPSSSADPGLLGLTNSLLNPGTQPAPVKTPPKTKTSPTSTETPTESSDSLLGHLLGTNGILGSTGGLLPHNQPAPTASSSSFAYVAPISSSSDGGILVGLTSAIPNVLSPGQHKPTKTKDSLLGISSLPLPVQSVLPTGVLPGNRPNPHNSDSYQSSSDDGLLHHVVGTLTDGVETVKSHATGLVGTLTDGVHSVVGTLTNDVGSLKSHATGIVGTLTSEVGTIKSQVPGVVGPLTDGIHSVVGTLTNEVGTIKSEVPGVVGPLTDGVHSVVGTLTNEVGTLTDSVGSAVPTGLVGTFTNGVGTAVSHATGLVGTLTTDLGTLTSPTGLVGTVTGGLGTATSLVNSLTNTLGITVPSGGYTITGGGVTLTVPIPTSVATDGPITVPSQATVATGTNGGYTITVPSGASSILSSLNSATGSATIETVPDSASSYPTSVPLSHSTKLTVGTTPSAYPSNDSTPAPASASSSVAPDTQTVAPHTIKPTATDSLTSMTFPTSWKFAPTSWTTRTSGLSTASGSTDTTVATGLPTYMPKLVQPPNGMPSAPSNATLIQLGFNYGLNYPFVVGEPDSAGQIFQYLPHGIAYGLGISSDLVKMNALMPYDTTGSMNYITTLAQAYIPSQFVDTIEMSIHMPLSEIYANPDDPVRTLMGMINPTIPILPGAAMEGGASSALYNPAATATTGPGAGAPIGGDSGTSNHVKPSTLGIGIGAVGGAAVYAAAMVYVARRYKQKRSGHQRASSVHTTGEMSQRSGGMGGFFMSGANGTQPGTGSGGRGSRTSAGSSNGRSVREQGISAPIMAENSLGWN